MHDVCLEDSPPLTEENGDKRLTACEVRGRKSLECFGVPDGNEVRPAKLGHDRNVGGEVTMDGQRDKFVQW